MIGLFSVVANEPVQVQDFGKLKLPIHLDEYMDFFSL